MIQLLAKPVQAPRVNGEGLYSHSDESRKGRIQKPP